MDYDVRAMDDAPLVRAACEGDTQAFADIYDKYADRIFSFLCTVVRNREDAADILQDTFLTAGARLHQLRDPEKLRPWLYAIARHLAMKSLSRSGKQDPLDENFEIADTSAGPADVASQGELAVLIREAAEGLGDQDRIVLDLHLRQGLEGRELGEALGVGAGHAYVMLSRMRDQVERSLGALLVARQGSKDCRKLEAILKPWDGRFTAIWRKRVARHVDGCDICGELQKRVLSPASMLGAIPLVAAPAYARVAVLEEVQLVGSEGELSSIDPSARVDNSKWPAGLGGFPPPMPLRRRRPPLAALLAGAFVLILLLAVPTVALMGDPEPDSSGKPGAADEVVETPVSYPLVFNDYVLKTPQSPEPEVVVDAGTDPAATKPGGGGSIIKPAPPRPKPKPVLTAAPQPAPVPPARPSPVPPERPTPSPGAPGGPGSLGVRGEDGNPSDPVRGADDRRVVPSPRRDPEP